MRPLREGMVSQTPSLTLIGIDVDKNILGAFTSELRKECGAVFINGDDSAKDKNLTSPIIASKAFQGVFSDVLSSSSPSERYSRLLSEG
jgi:hypothetical protein